MSTVSLAGIVRAAVKTRSLQLVPKVIVPPAATSDCSVAKSQVVMVVEAAKRLANTDPLVGESS
jgi:hypothetical protein